MANMKITAGGFAEERDVQKRAKTQDESLMRFVAVEKKRKRTRGVYSRL